MTRPIHALLSRKAVAHNIAVVRSLAPESKVWAVLKADAYGHGLRRIAAGDSPALAGADGIAILDIEAAAQLRLLGWTKPILLLEGCFDAQDLAEAIHLGVTTTVHHDEQIALIDAASPPDPLAIYLKMNSGMNRLGFPAAHYRDVHARLARRSDIGSITMATHFANADRVDGIAAQMGVFERAVQGLPGLWSVANSAAILAHRPQGGSQDGSQHGSQHARQQDWVRPGVMIYGASPFATRSAADCGLVPAMQLRSRLIAVQTLKPGDGVGYGHRYVADRPMRIGVVACGYADGYPRVAPVGTPIAVAGVRTGLVGQVSMDMLTVDLTAVPAAEVGSDVELWGSVVSVDEVAQSAGTVGYELLCAVAPRVPFITID